MNLAKVFDTTKPMFTRGRTTTVDGRGIFLTGGTAVRLFEDRHAIRASLSIKQDDTTVRRYPVVLPPEFGRPDGIIRQSVRKDGLFPDYPVDALRLHAPLMYHSAASTGGDRSYFAVPRDYTQGKFVGHFLLMSVVCAQMDEQRQSPKIEGFALQFQKATKTVSFAYNGKTVMHVEITKRALQFGNFTFRSSAELFEALVGWAAAGPIETPSKTKMTPALNTGNFYPVTHGLYTGCKLLADARGEKLGAYVRNRDEFSFACLNSAYRNLNQSPASVGDEFDFS